MKKLNRILFTTLLLISASTSTDASTFNIELTPLYGYRNGGEFNDDINDSKHTIESSEMYGDLGLKRLMRDIKKDKKTTDWRFIKTKWQSALAIAVTLVIVIQGILLYSFSLRTGQITTLSGPIQKGVVLQVSFVPNATELQVRKVLQSVEGTIIDGPGALGIYRIRLNLDIENEERIKDTIIRLKSHAEVVSHVARE